MSTSNLYAPSNATRWCLNSHGHHRSGQLPALGFFSSRLLLLSRCRQLLVHRRQFLRLSGRLAVPSRDFFAVAFTECLRMFYGHRSWVFSVHLRHLIVIFRFRFQPLRLTFVEVGQLEVVFLGLGTRDQSLDFLLAERWFSSGAIPRRHEHHER